MSKIIYFLLFVFFILETSFLFSQSLSYLHPCILDLDWGGNWRVCNLREAAHILKCFHVRGKGIQAELLCVKKKKKNSQLPQSGQI